MEVDDDVKRMLLPPLIALPIVVGLLLVSLGGVDIIAADTEGTPVPPNAWTMVYIGSAILIGNGVFWPLLYTYRGKEKREERVRRARGGSEEE